MGIKGFWSLFQWLRDAWPAMFENFLAALALGVGTAFVAEEVGFDSKSAGVVADSVSAIYFYNKELPVHASGFWENFKVFMQYLQARTDGNDEYIQENKEHIEDVRTAISGHGGLMICEAMVPFVLRSSKFYSEMKEILSGEMPAQEETGVQQNR